MVLDLNKLFFNPTTETKRTKQSAVCATKPHVGGNGLGRWLVEVLLLQREDILRIVESRFLDVWELFLDNSPWKIEKVCILTLTAEAHTLKQLRDWKCDVLVLDHKTFSCGKGLCFRLGIHEVVWAPV